MVGIKSLLFDTNVWISYFLARDPEYATVARLIVQAEKFGITLLYTPTVLKDMFYIAPRILRQQAIEEGTYVEEASFKPAAWASVRKITEIAVAVPQALPECDLAWMLRNTHNDYEDNLLFAAAETCNADYVVTTDKAFLEHFAPACITPEQALRLIELYHPSAAR